MSNPNNYEGANVTIVGHAGSDSEFPPYDKSGERGFSQVRVAVGMGYKNKTTDEWVDKGTMWFTVNGHTEGLAHIRKGDKLRIDDAKLEAREFERKDGSLGQAFETSYGDVIVLESKSASAANAGSNAGSTDDLPF